jgi:Tol biopolymer transport system component
MDVESPDYSPDGKKIAYTGNCFRTSDSEIYKINAAGGKPVQVTSSKNEVAIDPSWGAVPRASGSSHRLQRE